MNIAKLIIKERGKINIEERKKIALYDELLLHALKHENIEIIKLLLDHGADVNVRGKN